VPVVVMPVRTRWVMGRRSSGQTNGKGPTGQSVIVTFRAGAYDARKMWRDPVRI